MEFVDGATINNSVDNMKLNKCLLCFNELNDGVEIFGHVGRAVNAQQIIQKYFWSELIDESDPMSQYVCFDCWLKIKSFHEFYMKVQEIHKPYDVEEINESQIEVGDMPVASVQEEPMFSQNSVIPSEMLLELNTENKIGPLFESVTDTVLCDVYNFETDFADNLLEMTNGITSFDPVDSFETETTCFDSVGNEKEEVIGLQIDFLNYDDEYLANINEDDVIHYENGEFNGTVNGGSYEAIDERSTGEENLSTTFTESTIAPPLQRRGRGRPRKTDKIPENLKVKRKRGRPPKYVPQFFANIEIPNTFKGRPRKDEREIDRIECFICHEPSESFSELRKHLQSHDPEESSLLCFVCGKIFEDENTLTTHLTRSHLDTYTACPFCEKQMKYKYLENHITEVHENKRRRSLDFECNLCGRICVSLKGLIQHASTHINDELTRVQCEICEKWMKNEHTLQVHKRVHDENQVKCPHCDKVKPNVLKLRSHIALTHSMRKHICQICHKSFNRPILLKEHLALHTGEMLYNCAYCPKECNSNANMYKHLRETHAEQWNMDRASSKSNRSF